jgi:predicted DNA-binding transcriptional regulator AlpA
MAYQARVAIDRIKCAIRHAEQSAQPCVHMREAGMQLLDALERLQSLDRRLQIRSRVAVERNLNRSLLMATSPIRTATASPNNMTAAVEGTSPAWQQITEPHRLLTINDVAELLGVSKAWVYDHVTRKRPFLPCVRLGEITQFRRRHNAFRPSQIRPPDIPQ